MKRILTMVLALVMIATVAFAALVPASAEEPTTTPEVSEYASLYTGESDTSWYYDNPDATEFHITSADQWAGFSELVGYDFVTFDNKTVYLDCDIVWNDGEFTLDAEGNPLFNGEPAVADENVNFYEPIGDRDSCAPTNTPHNSSTKLAGQFQGAFDGQGHVISGLFSDYSKEGAAFVGLFSIFCGDAIKNISVVNSYFRGHSRSGSIAGFICVPDARTLNETGDYVGTILSNIYSNAYVILDGNNENNSRSGGLVGMIRSLPDNVYEDSDPATNGYIFKLEKCWFDGVIWATHTTRYNGGLVGMCALDDNTGNRETTTDNGLHNEIQVVDCLVTGEINNVAEPVSFAPTSSIRIGLVLGGVFRGYANISNTIVALRDTNIKEENGFLPPMKDILADDGVTVTGQEKRTGKAIVSYYESLPCEVTYENVYWVPIGMFQEDLPTHYVAEGQGVVESQVSTGEPVADATLASAYIALMNNEAFAFEVDGEGAFVVTLTGIKTVVDPLEETTPDEGEGDTTTEDTTIEDTTPDVGGDDTTPVVDDTTPVVDDTTPVVDDTTPVVDDTTPVVDDTTPVDTPVDTTAKPADTTAKPADTTAKPADTTAAAAEEGGCGCGGVATGALAALALIAVTGAAIVIKKK